MLATCSGILGEGLRSIIEQCGFRVFACQATGREFLFDDPTARKCQIFVIDASDDIEYNRTKNFVTLIRQKNQAGHIVILISPHLANAFDPVIVAEASAIVTTDVTAYVLESLLQLVSQNYVIHSANVSVEPNSGKTRIIGEAIPSPIQRPGPLPMIDKSLMGLSTRESEIILHVMRGSSNKVIARALGIAEATVKIHIKGIFRKIGVANRTQAAFYAFNQGWFGGEDVPPPDVFSPQDAVPPPTQTTNSFTNGLDISVPRNVLR